ncbi:MAG: sn-glycerol-1-phosphate dehydrogenase [Massilibacteroides sp.]|nr:sn-glycerol-1-phosphate dehydrogenase [Massilibacteroides sp.]MDD3063422.1 sn-glycerol-1-phosphate dehydrogenase [Massilibacteroides sp.]MDD4114140.1 sn-glycerol-1-phosphate dehydrogenase [Massilibacteroides sp.]MDD4660473.1 sn-glycerol-1-phosphate dehydrogenase [Massilibacteroides sp.]
MSKVEKALQSANDTKALLIRVDALNKVGELFKKLYPNKEAVIIADQTTYAVAGKAVEKNLKKEGIKQQRPFIYKTENLYAEYTYVEELAKSLKQHEAIPIAVGSGTINDLTKLASHLTHRHYICVATAASMDGYTAFGASITANGAKQTFNCPAPQACLADIEIIRKAPGKMTSSGYADLFAKITAGADWILADVLGVEPIDKQAWSIVQDGLHDSLADPEGVRNGDIKAISALIEGLMLGGFAMQWSKSSRPASGAEHQFSHLWNMEHHLYNKQSVSHGFQVAIGTLAILALYEEFLNTPITEMDIQACCEAWPTAEKLEKESLDIFKNTDFPEIGYQETKAKYVTKDALAQQLQILKERWPEIQEKIRAQLISFEDAKKRLKCVGAPTEPEEIGISREYLKQTFIRAQYIRRRFTVLDIAVRTNYLNKWLDRLFGKGGIWEIV